MEDELSDPEPVSRKKRLVTFSLQWHADTLQKLDEVRGTKSRSGFLYQCFEAATTTAASAQPALPKLRAEYAEALQFALAQNDNDAEKAAVWLESKRPTRGGPFDVDRATLVRMLKREQGVGA